VSDSPYTTDPHFPDGSPRRYAGFHRPPFDYAALKKQMEDDGWQFSAWTNSSDFKRDWENGDFDTPLYWLEPVEQS
jgi:hypothetical protein